MSIPKKILVRAPNWIGDQILAYPFFHYLRQSLPDARIVSTCVPWVESLQFRECVDEVIVLPRKLRGGLMGHLDAMEKGAALLRSKGPWDLAIALPNSFTSAWHLFRAGAKERIGYSVEGRGVLLNQRRDWAKGAKLHRTDAYLGLLPEYCEASKSSSDFWGVAPENELDPGIPGELSEFDPEKQWPEEEILEPPARDYWVLAPGSAAEARRWPVERFAALARRITAETGWTGVIVGGLAEAALAEKLCGDRGGGVKLLDRTARGPVSALWKLFRHARFTVANDSGLAHVAALCGSPVQVIWGAGEPKRTRPIGPGLVQLSLNAVECWPCERNICERQRGPALECLTGIHVETVWQEIQQGFRRNLR